MARLNGNSATRYMYNFTHVTYNRYLGRITPVIDTCSHSQSRMYAANQRTQSATLTLMTTLPIPTDHISPWHHYHLVSMLFYPLLSSALSASQTCPLFWQPKSPYPFSPHL